MSNIATKLNYKQFVVGSRLKYFKPHATKIQQSFSDEIKSGLSSKNKNINPKFFYDQKGSKLFEEICKLPEYYVTRTEESILKKLKTTLPNILDDSYRLVELGSGSSTKTRLLLDMLKHQNDFEYFPIDISEILTESSQLLLDYYDNLHITGIVDTYEGGLEFIKHYDTAKNLVIFLGSSLGNFAPKDGLAFLSNVCSAMKKDDLFLIGLDLVKDKQILENAYDDSSQITSEFNLNVLSRINDELDADFDLSNFEHYATYNEKEQRIEMYLKSLVNQTVNISKINMSVHFKKNELIHTEFSYKYRISQIEDMLEKSGFNIKQIWLDEKRFFSVTLASKNSKHLRHI